MSEKMGAIKILVCIFAVLSGEESDHRIFERLEEHYVTNCDRKGSVRFAVFADLPDHRKRKTTEDERLIANAQKEILSLRERYEEPFSLWIRNRRHSDKEAIYMGKERERGAYTELCRFLRGEEMEFALKIVDCDAIAQVTHLLILEEAFRLPRETLCRMIDVVSEPQNHPIWDQEKGRVINGHGIFLPNIQAISSSFNRTPFSFFVQKKKPKHPPRLIHIDSYLSLFRNFFPEERILNSDLIENDLACAKEIPEVTLFCEILHTAKDYYLCAHTQMCCHLQLLPYVSQNIRREHTGKTENPLSRAGKIRIVQRIFSDAIPLLSLLFLFFGHFGGGMQYFSIAAILLPLLYFLHDSNDDRKKTMVSLVFYFGTLAFEAYLFAQSLLSVFWSCAVTQSGFMKQTHKQEKTPCLDGYLLYFSPSMMIGILFFCVRGLIPKLFGVFWMAMPIVFWNVSVKQKSKQLCMKDEATIKRYMQDFWQFFCREVNQETQYLPPAHLQISPDCNADSYTTPSAIGFYLLSLLTAKEFRFITKEEFMNRSLHAAKTLQKLLKWNGHLFHGYDLDTLRPIDSAFISTSESGIFINTLIVFCEGLRESEEEEYAFSEIREILHAIREEMDFSFLYDEAKQLFYRGYHMDTGVYTEEHEENASGLSQLTSFYAVSCGQVPLEHEGATVQYLTKRKHCIVSDQAAASESFLPALFLGKNDALQAIYKAQRKQCVKRKIYGKKISVFGQSESSYFAFDGEMQYCSKAFGIPKLAVYQTSKEDVIAPYASFLMLKESPDGMMENLEALESLGIYGKYGFYDAVDFEKSRVGKGYAKIQIYHAFHIGISFVCAADLIRQGQVQKRFFRDPVMRSAMGVSKKTERRYVAHIRKKLSLKERTSFAIHPLKEAPSDTYAYTLLHPDMAMLSNHKTRIKASSSGHIHVESGRCSLFYSDFDLYSLKNGFCVSVILDGISFPTVPLMHEAKGFSSVFSFYSDGKMIEYRSRHQKEEKSYDIICKLFVFPDQEIFEITCEIFGNFLSASLKIDFETMLCERKKKSPESLQCEYHSDENVFLFSPKSEARHRYSMGIRFFPPIDEAKSIEGTIWHIQSAEVKEKGKIFRGVFAVNTDAEELLYDLTSLSDHKTNLLKTERLFDLQYQVCKVSERIFPLEQFLLRSVTFGQIRPASERFERMDPTAFSRFSISIDNPLVLVKGFSEASQAKARLLEMIGLFKWMCIRGMRYDFIILYRGNEEKDIIYSIIRHMGCEYFLSCGIFLIEETILTAKERFTYELYADAVLDLSYSLYRSASENARALTLSPKMESLLKKESQAKILPMEKPSHASGILLKKEEDSAIFRALSSSNFGTVVTSHSLGFTYVRYEGMLKLTPYIGNLEKAPGGEQLFLRFYNQYNKKDYLDYELCAVSAWVSYRPSEILYYGMIGQIRFCVSVHLFEKETVKCVKVHLESEESVCLAVIFAARPFLSEEKTEYRFYRFRKTGDGIHIVNRLGETGALVLFSPDMTILYTDMAAMKTDGAVFRGESDVAAIASRVDLCGKRDLRFYLGAVFSEKHNRHLHHRCFHENNILYDACIRSLDGRLYQMGRLDTIRSAFYIRNLAQDAVIYLRETPEIAKRLLFCIAAHQYEEGDFAVWYHPTGANMRGRCPEAALWFCFVVSEYLVKTNDISVLQARIAYLSSKPLEKKEYERYEIPNHTVDREMFLNHLKKAFQYIKSTSDSSEEPFLRMIEERLSYFMQMTEDF